MLIDIQTLLTKQKLIKVGGVLCKETVVEPWNEGTQWCLLLQASLASIEFCGIHKHHCTDSKIEAKMEKVIPEVCAGVWLHKVHDTCVHVKG